MKLEHATQLASLRFDDQGLIPVIAQEAVTGEVLMLAWANHEALERTLSTRLLWFYSRSRQALWQKGETSGNTQRVLELHLDCDADTILARVIPDGPACHTGERNCFGTAPTLQQLADVIASRARAAPSGSYTAKLLANANLRLKKLGEEATELALACQSGSTEQITAEAADLVYHVLVAAAAEGVQLASILSELDSRKT